jgi:hypothetical protein
MKSILAIALTTLIAVASTQTVGAQAYYGGAVIDNRASTPAESYSRGMADVIRSRGAANLMNSAAANNYEDARSKNLDNKLKYTETYFQNRQINESYQQQQSAERKERTYRYLQLEKSDKLQGLTDSQLDPVTGAINWPRELKSDMFADAREELEADFAARASTLGGLGPDQYAKILQTTDSMQASLQSQIKTIPPNDYLQARNFITGLANEAGMEHN